VRFLRALLIAGSIVPAGVAAQGVLIAPTAVFIDARTRAASLMVVNPNDQPAEIEIGTLFGYPVTDSAGQLVLKTVEQPDSTMPSAARVSPASAAATTSASRRSTSCWSRWTASPRTRKSS
jgi:hypothetical protein